MADETNIKINLVTAADTKGAEEVTKAVQEATAATNETAQAQDGLKQTTDADAAAQKEHGDALDQARESLRRKLEELKGATSEAQKHEGATQKETTAAKAFDDAVGKLPFNLRSMAVATGGAAIAAGVLKAGFDAWVEKNPEIQASFENVASQISTLATDTLAQWFETWIMKAETAKGLLDGLTVALGGQTEEMKKAAEPVAGYATEVELAAERSKAFADSLREEADAARAAGEALQHELEMLKARNALAEAKGQNAYDQKIREIEASDMPADEKARAKAEAKAAKETEDLRRREEERAKEGDVLRGEAEAKERAAREMQRKADEAAKRRADLQNREGISNVQIPALEKNLREAQDAWSAGTSEGVVSPEEAARLQKAIADAQAALERKRAERDAIAPGDAAEENKKAQAAAEAADKARKDAEAARDAANRGQAKNSVDNEADRERTKGRIDQIMWKGDEEAATANREKKEREDREAKRKEAEDKRRAEQAEKDRRDREKGANRAAGQTAAEHGDVTAQSLSNQGLGEAAKDLQQATSKLRDGATENEAAQAVAAMRELAPLIGQMNQQTREQMSALLREVETLKQQLKNSR